MAAKAGVGEKRAHEHGPGEVCKPSILENIGGNVSVLNAANQEAITSVLGAGDGAPLKSDADEQLIISLALPSISKLTAIKLAGPGDGSAPSKVKLFINKQSMSFDDCTDYPATQEFTLSAAEATLQLHPTKFASVSSLTVFIENNQADGEVTQLSHLQLVGQLIHTTNMNDLKKGG